MFSTKIFKSCTVLAVAVVVFCGSVMAEPEVPVKGLKAEGEKRWEDAVNIYKDAIAEDATRSDLWLRIAQIENATGDFDAAADAWQHVSDLSPKDSKLLFTLAKAYAQAGNPQGALDAAGQAVKLAPKNVEFLRARAVYANWVGKPDVAADSYRRILEENPDDKKALAGLKTVMGSGATAKDYQRIAADLQEQIARKPNDHKLRAELAQVYAMANEPAKALAAIDEAVALDPKNIKYLRARGQYANWIGKLEVAEDSYMRIIEIDPDDPDATLNLARAKSWGGHLDDSVDLFEKYIKERPDDRDALMDYIKVQSWRGNYSGAMDALEDYRRRFKETLEYRKQKARLLASAGKPAAAQEVLTPLLDVAPNDYEVFFTRTAAFYGARQRREVMQGLESLEAMRPDSEENKGLRRYVTANTRHSVKGAWEFYEESSGVEIETHSVNAGIQLTPSFRIAAGSDWRYLSADEGSGLASTDGTDPLTTEEVWGGVDWVVFPRIELSGKAGRTYTDTLEDADNSEMDSFRYAADLRLADALSVTYSDKKRIYAVSPRAASQGIYKRSQTARIMWTPGLNYTIDASGSQAKYSDGNRQWEAYVAPRRAVLRSQNLNLDLGLFMWWQAFEDQEFRGYYAPDFYEQYALKLNGYWKISANHGMSIAATAGVQRDKEISSKFEFGSGASVEGQFGLSPDWMLKVHVGNTHNLNSVIGDFDAQVYGVNLERRF